ncbi:hypothetical protein AX16_002540 [Volvariella volvacea WC 439]|nr:hypothetical protein AX16_002540 [Volvariella volvacea WC 439]
MKDDSNGDAECTNYSASAIVTSLYPDILSHIFLVVAESAEWSYRDYVPQTSHVCGYWRAVALQTYQLWNRFVLRDPKSLDCPWTQECIERTKSSLLDLTVYPYNGITLESLPDTHRVQSLKIESDELQLRSRWNLIEDLLQSFFSTLNPNLQSLAISYRRLIIHEDPPHLPFKLIHRNVPNLVHLHLVSCVPKDWDPLPHLSSLKVVELLGLKRLPPLEVLSRIPRLENLDIHLQSDSSASVSYTNTIHFASLREFSLVGSTTAIMRPVLANIRLPLCTRIKLECFGGTVQDFADFKTILMRFLTTSAPFLSTIPLQCMGLSDAWIVAVSADAHMHSQNDYDYTTAMEVMTTSDEISIEFDVDATEVQTFIADNIILPLALCFRRDHLRYLLWYPTTLDLDVRLRADKQFFSKLTELRVIDAMTDQPDFLDGIVFGREDTDLSRQEMSSQDDQISVPCPGLVILNIIHPEADGIALEDSSSETRARLFNNVSDKLMERKRLLGRSLEKLSVRGFGELNESEKMGLEAVAQEVYVVVKDVNSFLGY